jgi:K+-sensing histidine kinase KdpD
LLNRQRLTQERERALVTLEQRNRDMTLLTWVGQELTAMQDSGQVIERLLRAVSETIGAQGSSVWLWQDEPGGALVCEAVYHYGLGQKLVNMSVEAGQGVVGWVASHKKSTVVHTVSEDPRFSNQIDTKVGFRTTDILAVPLLAREAVIGVLEVVNKSTGRFTKDDLTLVETLAASAAVAIDNAHLIEALRQQTVELEARNEDLDAFAQTVAHDLKSPLALIASTAQVLELDFPDLSEEKLRHHLGVMAQRGRKASSLIEELLLLAELRHADIHIETLVMAPILTEAQKRLADMFTDQQPLIEMPTTWPAALGYGPWIEEVWVNYLSNALKYGGQPPQLELGAAKQRDGMVRF